MSRTQKALPRRKYHLRETQELMKQLEAVEDGLNKVMTDLTDEAEARIKHDDPAFDGDVWPEDTAPAHDNARDQVLEAIRILHGYLRDYKTL